MKISTDTDDDNYNYLVMDKKNNYKFVLNKYKTDKKYHSVEIDVPDTLKEVIQSYLKYHPLKGELKNNEYDIPFLVDEKGKALKNSTEITKILNKIFGKKISSSLLRNIFLTEKYSDIVEELKKDTQNMGTSVNTALNNYIKQD
jgi:flagellar biosynthesis component FlhA